MLAVLFPTASVSMQVAPCQVSTFKHGRTIAFWGLTTPLPFYALNRLMATGNRLRNVLQKGAGCVRPFSWQHANHCRVSNSNQQTKATMEVAKRQTTGHATHISMAVSEDHHSSASSQLFMSIECLEWFAARKISPQTLFRNQITEREVCMSSKQPDTELAIVYPSIYKGQSIGAKYRTLDRRWSQSRQFQTVWYGVDDIDGQNTVIIVEGEMDKLSLEEAGFTNVVSVPNGAPNKVKNGPLPEHSADKAFEYVWNCWEELQQASCILLGTDNDLPGHALAEELARRLGRERCRRINWTTDTDHNPSHSMQGPGRCIMHKDANDILIQEGPEALKWCVTNLQPLPLEGPYRVHRKIRRGTRQPATETATKA